MEAAFAASDGRSGKARKVQGTMAAGFEMRVSDAEREAAASELREHFASGRLTQDELNERLDRAFAAKTRGDLNALFTDLPSAGAGWSAPGAGRPGGGWPGGSAGADGPFGPGGPFGPNGPRGPFGGHGPGDTAWRAAPRAAGAIITLSVALLALFLLGVLGIFGMGAGRPLGIVLIIAAFALLRRLLMMIFGRRRRARGCGPRRRRW